MEMGTNAGRARNDRTLARSGPPPTRPEVADGAALARLWREKRGEAEPPDYSDNLNQNGSSPGSAGEAAKV
jgi:hypothetical protein